MEVPGFTAEAALRKTDKTYRSNARQHRPEQAVRPAGLDKECYQDCYKENFENCVDSCPDIPK